MRIITEPNVYLVTRPSVDWGVVNEFLEAEGLPPAISGSLRTNHDGEAIVEIAARLCYMSFAKGRKDIEDFINNLLSSGDGSVFEHVNYGFVFTGISRSLSHELVRHRAGFAYSQRSQRYVDESEPGFIVPPSILDQGEDSIAYKSLIHWFERAESVYKEMVGYAEIALSKDWSPPTERRKKVRQAARAVLPNATETKMLVTANVRAWRHFIEQRASPLADLEIKRLALRVLEVLQEEAPLFFNDFKIVSHDDGTTFAMTPWKKI